MTTPITRALVIIDAQKGVFQNVWKAPEIIQNIARALESARAAKQAIIWVQHADDELVHGSENWQLLAELVPREGELVLHKNYNSAFEQTKLEQNLKSLNISEVVLAGAATNWCIRATAYGALERGYDLTIVSDAHSTESMEFSSGLVVPAEALIADLNTVFRWITYPKRKTSILSSAEVFQA